MARDASGVYHIIFESSNGLAWATGYGSTWNIAAARVDSGVVPSHASVALDSLGAPHVAYFESSFARLRIRNSTRRFFAQASSLCRRSIGWVSP